ncbi:MAG: phage tail tape measure protein [Desulfovibrio sp.]|nr:phage tail tape measure protein [Desulfovibrio sp.]
MAGTSLKQLVARENELKAAAGKASAALGRQKALEDKLGKARDMRRDTLPYAQQAASSVGSGLMAAMTDGASLERQLSMVQAITRGSAEDMAKYEAQALQLGASTKFTSTQVAEGMQYLAMAGFKTNEVLTAMPGMLDLASAAAADLGTTADIASNVLTGFGLETAEIGRVGDVLTNTFQHSNTTLVTLGETMKYCAPVAKGFGMSLEETAAMAGLMGSAGIQASQAGTALRGMLVRLEKQPKQAAAALKELGVKAYDSAGKFKPLQQIFAEITQSDRWKRLKDAGKQKALAMIFGTEPLAGAQGLIDALQKGKMQEMLAGQYERGTAAATAKIQENNLIGDITKLTSAMSGLSQTLYKSVGGALRATVQRVTDIVGRFNEWLKVNPKVAKAIVWVAGGIAAVAAAALPCIVAVKTVLFVFSSLKAAFLGVSMVLPLLKTGMIAAGAACGPLGLIFGGLALVAAVLIANWKSISAWASKWWGAVSASVQTYCAQARQWVADNWSAISVAVRMFCIEAWQHIQGVWSAVAPYFARLWEAVKVIFSAAWQAICAVFEGWAASIGPVLEGVRDVLFGLLDFVAGVFTGNWSQAWEAVKTVFSGVWQVVGGLIDGAKATCMTLASFVAGAFTSAWTAAWNGVSGIFSGIWNGLKGVAQSVLDWIAGKLNSVIGLINGTIETMNKIPGVNIGKLDQIPTSQPKAMASGGIVTAPTFALVGEAGDEAVMPLDRLSSMLGQHAQPGQGAPAGVTLTFSPTINMSGGDSGDPYEAVRRGLSAGADDIKRQLERVLADQRRLSYA